MALAFALLGKLFYGISVSLRDTFFKGCLRLVAQGGRLLSQAGVA